MQINDRPFDTLFHRSVICDKISITVHSTWVFMSGCVVVLFACDFLSQAECCLFGLMHLWVAIPNVDVEMRHFSKESNTFPHIFAFSSPHRSLLLAMTIVAACVHCVLCACALCRATTSKMSSFLCILLPLCTKKLSNEILMYQFAAFYRLQIFSYEFFLSSFNFFCCRSWYCRWHSPLLRMQY